MLQISPKIKLLLFKLFRKPYKKWLFKRSENNIELKLLGYFLQNEKLFFIDVGANKGEFINIAGKYLPPNRIWAFEPLPWFAKKLQVLFPGIKVFQNALSDEEIKTTLYLPLHNGLPDDSLSSVRKPKEGDFLTYEINCQRLDSLMEEYNINDPVFLKIDVEGHEFSVLNGAKATLKKTISMLVEIEERHHAGKKLDEMIAEVEALGFVCYYFHPQKVLLLRFSEHPQGFQKTEDLNTSRYINNFWFFAKHLNYESVVKSLNQSIQ